MEPIRRGAFDIIANLLEVLSEGSFSKSRLAGRASLDTRSSERYVTMLTACNLAERDASSQNIKITQKGTGFLEEYRRLKLYLKLPLELTKID